jgi:hypothetical protein
MSQGFQLSNYWQLSANLMVVTTILSALLDLIRGDPTLYHIAPKSACSTPTPNQYFVCMFVCL